MGPEALWPAPMTELEAPGVVEDLGVRWTGDEPERESKAFG